MKEAIYAVSFLAIVPVGAILERRRDRKEPRINRRLPTNHSRYKSRTFSQYPRVILIS